MKLNIPEHCEIRWQAALAVLEDLQEDKEAPFNQGAWGDSLTQWEKTNGCGTPACFAGYIAVAPYCLKLGMDQFPHCRNIPGHADPHMVGAWLLGETYSRLRLYDELFDGRFGQRTRAATLEFLERRIKAIFKDSTGKKLVAPMTFYV